MNPESIVAVVVTYNRKALLLECLQAIFKQSVAISKIILIDNASTDGTKEALIDAGYFNDGRLQYNVMEKNLGGSGGFYEGIKIAKTLNCDWVWIMDDDTIPNIDCLENLLKAAAFLKEKNEVFSFLASAIYGCNGEFMNVPALDERPSKNGYQYWYKYLNKGLVNIKSATFVSILVRGDAIQRCGLPCKDYFIWGDDAEYTLRLTKHIGEAYLVGDSVAIHKRVGAKSLDIRNVEDPNRIRMYHYLYRNTMINGILYTEGFHPKYRALMLSLTGLKNIGHKFGFLKAFVILKGNIEGLTGYRKIKNYIDNEIVDK